MKVLLAALMCLVFTITQAFAISGGPWTGGGHVTVTGTYAGVLVPLVVVVDAGPPPVTLPPDNSLALFTLRIPQTGGGAGAAVVFRNGFFYPGVIDAVADPDTAKVSAIINAMFEVTGSESDSSKSIPARLNANGKFTTVKVAATKGNELTSSVRLKGQAELTYNCVCSSSNDCPPCADAGTNSGGPITYKVKGFKQSESSS
jgi:hypothetical protein